MLKVENVRVGYGPVEIIRGVSLEVKKGEIVTLIGANGAGKTTTLKAVCGSIPILSGSILFNGTYIDKKRPDEIVGLGISMVPEGRQLFPHLSVQDNLLLGAFKKAARDGHLSRLERVLELFPRLKERMTQAAGSLSGGEQQMTAIARGLMANPELLIFDEPSLGLSPLLVSQMFDIIQYIAQTGVTVLIVEQNIVHTLEICDRGYVLENGVIAISGSGRDLRSNSEVKRAYLGQ